MSRLRNQFFFSGCSPELLLGTNSVGVLVGDSVGAMLVGEKDGGASVGADDGQAVPKVVPTVAVEQNR
eukprot:CAMPEP_0114249182 /NCGR_PEP_ID=MMETSP0058-20121206/13997_1 /TAXON_ID=36894 /ORGANISM="Pyramimonas parkeae, CCMP726" /LENGTH=67 /DNA_ID=CAMNT_0001362693 /DNA_START=471 /DNA_END=674 /DNA_ORIENTATION=-